MSIFARREPESPSPPTSTPTSPQRSAPPRAAPAPPAATNRDQTHIASGSKVVGEISGAAELVIDGRVEGKIDLDSRVIVGPRGQIEGEVKARSVQISGRVLGNVRGVDRVEVLKSGRLEGDMVAPQNGVHIAEGAFFTGKIDMSRRAESTKSKGEEAREKAPPPGGSRQEAARIGAVGGPGKEEPKK